jgi:hypothetical protein
MEGFKIDSAPLRDGLSTQADLRYWSGDFTFQISDFRFCLMALKKEYE